MQSSTLSTVEDCAEADGAVVIECEISGTRERPAYKHQGHTLKAFDVLNILRK